MKVKIVFLLLLHLQIFSQNFETGRASSPGADKFFCKLIGEDKNGFYSLRYNFTNKGKNFYIVQCDRKSLNKLRTINIGKYEAEENIGRSIEIVRDFTKVITNIFLWKEKIYIFSKSFNPPEKSVQLIADIFSTVNGEMLVADSVLYNIHSYRYDIYEKKYHLSLNSDSTKLLCASLSSLSDDLQTANVTLFSMYDFSAVWDKELMSEHKGYKINVKASVCAVDDKDDLFYSFSASKTTGSVTEISDGLAYYGKSDKKEKVIVFNLQGDVLQYNSGVKYDRAEGAVYFTGNFKDSKKIKTRNAGIIVSKLMINENFKWSGDTVYFSEENKRKIECDSLQTSITKYSFSPVMVRKIGDVNYLYTYMDYHELRESRSYHGSDMIFVFKLKENGKVEWQNLLPRSTFFKYVTTNNDLTEMLVFERENKLNFLFTDDISNERNSSYCHLKPTGYFSNTNLVQVAIDPNGIMEKKVIYTNGKICILPFSTEILSDKNEHIFRYRNGETEGFGKLRKE